MAAILWVQTTITTLSCTLKMLFTVVFLCLIALLEVEIRCVNSYVTPRQIEHKYACFELWFSATE